MSFIHVPVVWLCASGYAPINVMPHLPQVGPGWGHIGVLHQLISKRLTPGAILMSKSPTNPQLQPLVLSRGNLGNI